MYIHVTCRVYFKDACDVLTSAELLHIEVHGFNRWTFSNENILLINSDMFNSYKPGVLFVGHGQTA